MEEELEIHAGQRARHVCSVRSESAENKGPMNNGKNQRCFLEPSSSYLSIGYILIFIIILFIILCVGAHATMRSKDISLQESVLFHYLGPGH